MYVLTGSDVRADTQCVCNHGDMKRVYSRPYLDSDWLGHLRETQCLELQGVYDGSAFVQVSFQDMVSHKLHVLMSPYKGR